MFKHKDKAIFLQCCFLGSQGGSGVVIVARILVVADDPLIRRAVNTTLVQGGHQIDDANDSTEALKVLARQPVDLVIGDIQMPVLNGRMLFQSVKRMYPQIGFVAMSGCYQVTDFPDLAFDGFLYKPFSCADLMNAVERVLSGCSPPFSHPLISPDQPVL